MRAKTIDRLALTRQKFGAKMYGDEVNPSKSTGLRQQIIDEPVKGSKSTPLDEPKSVGQQIIDGLKEAIEAERANNHREGYSICPSCGQETLIHEDGCMHCRLCGWSACG